MTDRTPQATPLVRRLAADLGVDLTTVQGTGVGDRIRASDVRAAATRSAYDDLYGPTAAGPVQDPTPASTAYHDLYGG